MIRSLFLILSLCVAIHAHPQAAVADRPVLVFAAASLKSALDDVAAQYRAATGQEMTMSYAGSSVLARQILNGAPADIFISANQDWMSVLEDEGLIVTDTHVDLLSNRMVLIAPADASALPDLSSETVVARLEDGPLALALVEAVPAGIYARAALQSLDLWDGVSAFVAQTDNVRAALRLVAIGEAPLGVVYATDATADPDVQLIHLFPAESHPRIVYPAAQVTGTTAENTADVFEFLTGPKARSIFSAHGFLVPEVPS